MSLWLLSGAVVFADEGAIKLGPPVPRTNLRQAKSDCARKKQRLPTIRELATFFNPDAIHHRPGSSRYGRQGCHQGDRGKNLKPSRDCDKPISEPWTKVDVRRLNQIDFYYDRVGDRGVNAKRFRKSPLRDQKGFWLWSSDRSIHGAPWGFHTMTGDF